MYVHIRVKAHKKFTREGNIILSEEHISMVDAALGTEIDVETVDGVITMKIPAGTQSGTDFKSVSYTHLQPTESTIEVVKSTKIALLAGISGAGKDTIKKQLLKSPEFRDIVSHTTRAPRTNNGCAEQDGIDYHFIDSQTAENMLQNNEFIEAKFVHGTDRKSVV